MDYEQQIEIIIPEAEKYTNKKIKVKHYSSGSKYRSEWDKTYLDKMDELAASIGIRYTSKYRRDI